ncbi:MAG: hypothetical protein WCY19_00995 [Candidatus Gastranaerophilaceae bacterium]
MADKLTVSVSNGEDANVELDGILNSQSGIINLVTDTSPAITVDKSTNLEMTDTQTDVSAAIAAHDHDRNVHSEALGKLRNDLALKADISNVPTKTSQITNDSNFATTSQLPVVPTAVSSFTNDASYVNSTQMSVALAAKSDTNLSNINSVGKSVVASLPMPDYSRGVSKSWNTSYTAECDGWLLVVMAIYANTDTSHLLINNISVAELYDEKSYSQTSTLIPVNKGDIYIASGGYNIWCGLKFYPAKGAS